MIVSFKEGVINIADKKQLNTPITADLLDQFRDACNDYNLKMNAVIEALLSDFVNGDYDIIINRKDGIKITKK